MSKRLEKKIIEEEEIEDDEEDEIEEDDDVEVEEDEDEEYEEEEEEEDSVDEFEIHVYDENGKEVFETENDDEWIVDASEAEITQQPEKVELSTSRFWNWLKEEYIEAHGGLEAVRRKGPIYIYDENEFVAKSAEKDEKVEGRRKERIEISLFDRNIEGDENIEKKFNEVVEKTKQKDRDELPYYLVLLENKCESVQLKFKIAAGLIHVIVTNINRTKRPGVNMDKEEQKIVKEALGRIVEYLKINEIIEVMKDRSVASKISLILSRFIEDEMHSLKSVAYPSQAYEDKIKEINETINQALVILSTLKTIIDTSDKELREFVLLFIDLSLSILKAIHCFADETNYVFGEKTLTLKQLVTALALLVFNESQDEEMRQMAFLCHTAYLARHGDYSAHKLLVSFPTSVHTSDVMLMIYQNRANVLTAMSAFRAKRYDITYILLHDLIEQTSHVQTVLGQVNLKNETKSVPKHMFIDVSLVKVMYYVAAIISEDGEQPQNKLVFKKMIENRRDVIQVTSTKLIYYAQMIHASLIEGNYSHVVSYTKKLIGSHIEEVDYNHIEHCLKLITINHFVQKYRKFYSELTAAHIAALFEVSEEEAKPFLEKKEEVAIKPIEQEEKKEEEKVEEEKEEEPKKEVVDLDN